MYSLSFCPSLSPSVSPIALPLRASQACLPTSPLSLQPFFFRFPNESVRYAGIQKTSVNYMTSISFWDTNEEG